MAPTRVYQPALLSIQTRIRLDKKASHHVAHVLRARTGDKVYVFNGTGGEYEAIITAIGKSGVEVEILQFSAREAESPIHIHLAQGIARGEKMDFIIQKAVELGVNKIIPLVTERCNVRVDQGRSDKRLRHWQSVMMSACEQCGRNRLMDIAPPLSFLTWLPTVEANHCFVLSPQATAHLPLPTNPPPNGTYVLVIGPEGGLREREIEAAIHYGFLPLNLGPRILRTETAALAAITLIQARYGDML